jgi:mannosyltransferase
VLALALRLWGLSSESLVQDEVYELNLVKQSVAAVVQDQDGFPPLYQLLLRVWLAAFPDNPRLFSVLCGMLTIPVVWQIGALAGGLASAATAAFLVSISPIHIWCAQEARAYALFYLLATLAVLLFIRAMLNNRFRDWLYYGLVSIAGLYTHYFFTLVVGALLATVPFFPDARSRLPGLVRTHLVVAVMAIPWLWLLIPDLEHQSGHSPRPMPLDFQSVGPAARKLLNLPWGVAAVVVCALAIPPLLSTETTKRWMLRLGIVVIVPIAACGIADAILHLGFRVRYVGWCASILIIILSLGLTQRLRSVPSLLAIALLVAGSTVTLATRHFNPRFSNEDIRAAAGYISAHLDVSNVAFVSSNDMSSPSSYYLGSASKAFALPDVAPNGPPTAGLDVIRANILAGQKFWLVYSRPWDGDPDGSLRNHLQAVAKLKLRGEWAGVQLYEGEGW